MLHFSKTLIPLTSNTQRSPRVSITLIVLFQPRFALSSLAAFSFSLARTGPRGKPDRPEGPRGRQVQITIPYQVLPPERKGEKPENKGRGQRTGLSDRRPSSAGLGFWVMPSFALWHFKGTAWPRTSLFPKILSFAIFTLYTFSLNV